MKILIWGCGSIGARHARNASAVADVILCDSDQARLSALALEIAPLAAVSSLEAAQAHKPDGIIIALPNDLHYKAAVQAQATGAAVLIEKPVCLNLDQARHLNDIAKDRMFVVSNMRFHPAIEALRSGLKSIGKPLFVRAQFGNYLPNMRSHQDYRTLYAAKKAAGGGVLMDCIHEIDYLCDFFGPVTSLTAQLAKISDLEIETEDYAALQMSHDSGVKTELHLDYLQQFKQRGCEIIGSQGTLVWRSLGKAPEICEVRLYDAATQVWMDLFRTDNLDMNESYVKLMKAFVDVISGSSCEPRLSTITQGVQALSCVLGAYQSSDEGKKVVLS